MTSVIRSESQKPEIIALGATPVLLSVEDATVDRWLSLLRNADVVYYSASAAGVRGEDREERLRQTDFEGAVKVFDAIAQLSEGPERKKPRVIVLGAVDVRNPDKPIPEHYVSTPFIDIISVELMGASH